jgi:hypothetical protein
LTAGGEPASTPMMRACTCRQPRIEPSVRRDLGLWRRSITGFSYPPERKAALERWGRFVEGLIRRDQTNVVALAR